MLPYDALMSYFDVFALGFVSKQSLVAHRSPNLSFSSLVLVFQYRQIFLKCTTSYNLGID